MLHLRGAVAARAVAPSRPSFLLLVRRAPIRSQILRQCRTIHQSNPRLAYRRPERGPQREPITIRTTAREVFSEPIKAVLITRHYIFSVVVAAIVVYWTFSQTIPVTRRRAFNVIPDPIIEWWNSDKADQLVEEVRRQGGHFLSDRDPRARAVNRVMSRLIPYSGIADRDWEVYVIQDNHTANAFVIPGGKVFVHSGILNVCHNEDALAAVLGHEIAHTTASHVGERMTQIGAFWFTVGSLFFLRGPWAGTAALSLGGAALLSALSALEIELPLSRRQEMEADYVGLMMMAEACYDPRAAVGFWQRMETMQAMNRQVEVPEYLSTHPANKHRIENIKEWMDEAMRKREESDCKGTMAFADRFREAIRRRQPQIAHE